MSGERIIQWWGESAGGRGLHEDWPAGPHGPYPKTGYFWLLPMVVRLEYGPSAASFSDFLKETLESSFYMKFPDF